MTGPDVPHRAPAPLLPAGRRWGRGAGSVAPYLRDSWARRPNNPVFTPQQVARLVWPAAPVQPPASS